MTEDTGRKLGVGEMQGDSFESGGSFLESLRGLGGKALGVVKRVRDGMVSTVKPLGSAAAGVAALGAVGAASLPDSADAKAFVTAGANPGNGQIYVVQDVPPEGDVAVTPDMYDVPIPAGSVAGELESIDNSHFVRAVVHQNGIPEIQVLEFDGADFSVTGSVNLAQYNYPDEIKVLSGGRVSVQAYDGVYTFDSNDPIGTFEPVALSNADEAFGTVAPFTDSSGNQCYLVAGEENVIRLVAETQEGVTETLIPIPPEVLLSGIWGLRIGDGQLAINNGGRVYIAPFDPNNPQALIDDIQNAVLVHEATVDSINDAVSVDDSVVVGEGDNVAIYTGDGASMARDDLEIYGQRGFEVDGDLLHVATSSSVVTIDPNAKTVIRTVTGEVDAPFGAPGGLAVLSGDPELEALTELPPIGNIHTPASGPGYTAVEGPEEDSVQYTVDLASLETPGDSISIPFMSVLDSGPEHSIYVSLTYDTIPLGGSLDPIILEGTGGWVTFTNVGGNIVAGLTVGNDGRLGTSSGTLQGSEVVEGSTDNSASHEVGSYADMRAEATGSGDDDDTGTPQVDDDDATGEVPAGCADAGCNNTLKNGDTKNLGNFGALLATAGVVGTRRKKAKRRAARRR